MALRVLVDARPAVPALRTGIGLYTSRLLELLPAALPEARLLAWHASVRGIGRRRRDGPLAWLGTAPPGVREVVTPIPGAWLERLSELAETPRVEWFAGFDVLLATNFVPPPTASSRLVATVHDLAFKRFPETAPHATRRWLARLDRYVHRARRLIAVSEATGRDLVELYGVDPGRVRVVPHGIDAEWFATAPSDAGEVLRRYRVQPPYLLFVGGIEPRKNLPRLVAAFARLSSDVRPQLVLAGSSVPWNPEGRRGLERALAAVPDDVRRRVVLTGYVSEEEKRALLAGALALVFPSLYEGFGFPVLEGMAAGIPVLTSDVAALPEVAADAALLVDPRDEDAIAGGIERLVTDDGLRARLVRSGRDRAGRYRWSDTARRTADVLREAADD